VDDWQRELPLDNHRDIAIADSTEYYRLAEGGMGLSCPCSLRVQPAEGAI
jgi:hypothetical protein